MTLDFPDPANVRVTAVTSIDENVANTDEMRRRIAEARDALANGRDEWSLHFAPLDPLTERSVIEKSSGALVRTERAITIPRAQLQRVFADTNITITVTNADGYTDLAVYPGASTRATRQQKAHVESTLHAWSVDASRYLAAMHRLYSYLDRQPERATVVFTRLLESEDTPVLEEEQTLVEDVGRTADAITERLRAAEREAVTVDEQFDRVFNPFPAEIVVHLPREEVSAEGFEKKDRDFVIKRRGLVDALQALEGRWLSPDPLLMQQRSGNDPSPTAAAIAAMPRTSSPMVSATDIETAVIEQLKPASEYRVRWPESPAK
ncbi:MAG: hypothetical protein ACXV7D_08785 [Thermoanaerobaculia bacterium]